MVIHVTRLCPTGFVSSVALGLALAGCSAEPDGGADVASYGAFPFGGSNGQVAPGAGGANAAQNGGNTSGQLGSNPGQATGGNTAFGGSPNTGNPGGAGGSASTGLGGTSAANNGGSSMVGVGGTTGVINPPPPAANCEGAAFFCESFDGLSLGPLQVTSGLTPERSVSVVTEAGRGQVLQIQAAPTYAGKAGVFLNNFSAPNNNHFGRMFARVAQFPTAGGDHWVMVEATGTGSAEQVRPVGGQFQRWAPGADGPSAGDWTDWDQSEAATTAGAWECVEWQMNGANGGNDIVLWINDTEVRPMDRGNFSFPTINRLWFGWVVYQAGQPAAYDVRLDDLVLSTERIGCD
jgi:hypothetical protein